MRIVAGEWRGRRLLAPRGASVRPTPERVREAWMSILQAELAGARVLDLFAGTGALGLESLSRGAAHVDFVDGDALALRTLVRNAESVGATPLCTVHRSDVFRFLDRWKGTADLAFADPPYRTGLAAQLAGRWLSKPFAAILGVEHESRIGLPDGGDRRTYGDTAITIYRR